MKYANHHGYTDVNPYEVIKIVSAKCIEIRAMIAEKDPSVVTQFVVGGFSAFSDNAQKWIIESDENCPVSFFQVRFIPHPPHYFRRGKCRRRLTR